MAHHPTHRRNLLTPDPQISKPITDLAGKSHAKKPSTTTAAVYNLTNHFSRLHPTSKPTKPQKLVDTHLQVKGLSKSVNFEPSIGKQGKRVVSESDKKKSLVVDNPASAVTAAKVERENEVIKPTRITIQKVMGLNLNAKIGRNRSFCGDAQLELANFLLTNSAKMVSVDMPPFMQIHAVGFARKIKDSLEKFTSKSLALSLKKEFDGAYGPAWHCIVGTSFGSFVTHSVGGFLYFAMDQKMYVLLFKTTVQRAD